MISVYSRNIYAPGNCTFCADRHQEVEGVITFWGTRPSYPQTGKGSYWICASCHAGAVARARREYYGQPEPVVPPDPAAVRALEALEECRRRIDKKWANMS